MAVMCLVMSAQNKFKARILDGESGEPLAGASVMVQKTNLGGTSDAEGVVTIEKIPDGVFTIVFSYIGFETESKKIKFPLANPDATVEIRLEEEENELEEVVVTATRSTRSFANTPTRIEFIGQEEVDEKVTNKPGDVRMMLSESTGIQIQQTSAISGNSLVRIQGLDGRYTQILKDGFPTAAGAASGLGLMQILPLDLRQVEIIKGSSSTLYGAGAIAGLINLVSKVPHEKREFTVQLNATSGKGYDANSFFSKRWDKVGVTAVASYNHNDAYDPSGIGFTAIPKFDRFTLNPTLFLYPSEKTQIRYGLESMLESRLGGAMDYVNNKENATDLYYEQNRSQRHDSRLSIRHEFGEESNLNVKNSVTYFRRRIEIPKYQFDGTQWSSFSELSYVHGGENTEWIGGLTLRTENFAEKQLSALPLRNFSLVTAGAFVQNTTNFAEWFALESGLRCDNVNDYGFVVLPRLSGLFKINENLTSRIGGDLGYNPPSIFTEDSELLQFQNVLPVDKKFNKLERSYGVNADVTWKKPLFDGKVHFSVNQLLFYTKVKNPLELKREADSDLYRFYNSPGSLTAAGAETNIKVKYDDFSLYLGYTYVDAAVSENGKRHDQTLSPRHRLNSMLMYEVEDSWRIGYETYYVGKQYLTDGTVGKDYVTMGIVVQKIWEHFSIYANFENFTDRRQARFDTVYTGTLSAPQFRDIYAPLDGFVANAGVIIKL